MNRLEYIKALKQRAIDFVRLTDYNIQQLESIDNEEFVMNITDYLGVFPVPRDERNIIIKLEQTNHEQSLIIKELCKELMPLRSSLFMARKANKKLKAQAAADMLTYCETVAIVAKEVDSAQAEVKNLQREIKNIQNKCTTYCKNQAAEKEELTKRNADLSKKIEQYELECSKLLKALSVSDLEDSIQNLKYLIHE